MSVVGIALWLLVSSCSAFMSDSGANTKISIDGVPDTMHFTGDDETSNHFKVVHLSRGSLLLGARNVLYNVSLDTMKENKRIRWSAGDSEMQLCGFNRKTSDECQNYIRVIAPTENDDFLVCGTNAFKPSCRRYQDVDSLSYKLLANESGVAKCPFDPAHNNTAVYAGDRLFSATVSDMSGRDALIYSDSVRTVQHDSQWLNEPDFISSYEYEDKVYFFFRETAVEYINCGKARFSRVARVCKNDHGGARVLRKTFTSFFKARLNCSIPGEYPFYFDEIQSTSEIGKGNIVPSVVLTDRETMIYAVFTTPQNSMGGSAVCAFKFSDVLKTFEGAFKEQKSASSNWLPAKDSEQPLPHPAKTCNNDSYNIPTSHLNFIKTHPLMDEAVPAFGNQPVLFTASFNYRMTTIAVDWQFRAADDRYYDVLFIGTDQGHVLKAINKGSNTRMDPVIIEDLEVFPNQPVVELKVYRNFGAGEEKLIAISANEVKNIPLHRCQMHPTCSACVAAQDPYCAWLNGDCAKTNSRGSVQSLQTGVHPQCQPSNSDDGGNLDSGVAPSSETLHQPTSSEKREPLTAVPTTAAIPTVDWEVRTERAKTTDSELDNHIPVALPDPCVEASVGRSPSTQHSASDMAVAVIFSILCGLVVGIVLGYFFNLWRVNRQQPSETICNSNQQKTENMYDVAPGALHRRNDFSPSPKPVSSSPSEKQLNVVYNPLKPKSPNGGVQTTVRCSKKEYV